LIGYTSKIEARNEPKTFTSKLTSKDTSASEKSLKSIKVDERKCKDGTKVFSSSDTSSFTIKA
jgi:hypothetical protein